SLCLVGGVKVQQEWQAEDLQLSSSSSNETCKIMTWCNDDTLGRGGKGCISRLQDRDPTFGRIGLESSAVVLSVVSCHLVDSCWAPFFLLSRCLPRACSLWDDILVENHTDMLASKLAQVDLFYLGNQAQMKDTLARILPHWKPHMPLYRYMLRGGTHLHRYMWGPCATEAVLNKVHLRLFTVIKMYRCDVFQGNNMLASHNYWHWALHHIEKVKVGVCVLLRGRCEGLVARTVSGDHVLLFNNLHFLMASLRAGEERASHQWCSLSPHVPENHTLQLALPIGVPMSQALVEFHRSNYSHAVELLQPIWYWIHEIGGSNAVMFRFSGTFHAAVRSKKQHCTLTRFVSAPCLLRHPPVCSLLRCDTSSNINLIHTLILFYFCVPRAPALPYIYAAPPADADELIIK
uniref:Tetratricopeptide repeat domain 38 n=1 Tax=Scleropages formosus TaxID=113540 RepID=A0A8C9R5V1_SCLFO